MGSADERARERAGLLAELWQGGAGGPGRAPSHGNGNGHGNGAVPGGAADPLSGRLLRTREVALLFQVSERAVTDWARRGRLPSVRTPGGHRRYPATAVRGLLETTGLGPG